MSWGGVGSLEDEGTLPTIKSYLYLITVIYSQETGKGGGTLTREYLTQSPFAPESGVATTFWHNWLVVNGTF